MFLAFLRMDGLLPFSFFFMKMFSLVSLMTPPNFTSFRLFFSYCLLISVLTDSCSIFIY